MSAAAPLWTAEEAAVATGGETAGNWLAYGVSIDTRTLKAGDLFVAIHVVPSPAFERRGDDLWHRLPVSIVQAALGATMQMETLDGARQLEVQSGTQPGARLRLQGLGVPSLRNGRRGDLVIEVDVQVPTNLTPDQAELLAQLAQLRGEEVTAPHEGLFSRIRSAFRQ